MLLVPLSLASPRTQCTVANCVREPDVYCTLLWRRAAKRVSLALYNEPAVCSVLSCTVYRVGEMASAKCGVFRREAIPLARFRASFRLSAFCDSVLYDGICRPKYVVASSRER